MREGFSPGLTGPDALLFRACQIEFAGGSPSDLGTAAAPDPVPHVGISRVANTRLPEGTEILLVLLDLQVAPREVQRNLRHVMHVGVADVPDVDTRVGVALLDPYESFGATEFGR